MPLCRQHACACIEDVTGRLGLASKEIDAMLDGKTISEVFNEFCLPVLQKYKDAGGTGDLKEVGALFVIPMLIWNAIVLCDECGDDSHLIKYLEYLHEVPKDLQPVYDKMMFLKRAEFRQYKFLLDDFQAKKVDGGLLINFTAAMPPKPKRDGVH